MKRSCSSTSVFALTLLASCAATREQDPADSAAIRDLVARIEVTEQGQVDKLLRSVAAEVGEERAIRMVRRILLEEEPAPSVAGKILAQIDALGLAALPAVRDAVRVPAFQPASVWALQRYCVGATPDMPDHPLADADIVYLGSILESANADTAKAAAVTLKSAGSRQRLVLPELIDALRKQSARAISDSSGQCSSLLICIGHAGATASPAAPIVLSKLDDEPDRSTQSLILWTLCSIIPDCRRALSVLIAAFASPQEAEDLKKHLDDRR